MPETIMGMEAKRAMKLSIAVMLLLTPMIKKKVGETEERVVRCVGFGTLDVFCVAFLGFTLLLLL